MNDIEFKESKDKNGWTLNIVKINTIIITTSLYDDGGKIIETKSFNANEAKAIDALKLYISLFEENPERNLQHMLKIK